MSGGREHINTQLLDIYRDVPNCLDGIGMKKGSMGMSDFTELGNRLNCSELIVCEHDRHKIRIVGDKGSKSFRSDNPR